jgi:predicted NBD/HSP70 family sugar kinase
MKSHLVAVDIGGSKMSFLAREEESGLDVYADKIKTPADEGLEAVVAALDEEIDAMPGGRGAMSGLGVAVPGPVDLQGKVVRAGNLEGWIDVPLRALLEKRYRVPVFVERDSNCGALGEKWCGAATSLDSFVFLALGTGVGAGLFLDGHLYRGAHFASGEAGDLTFFRGEKRENLSEIVGKQAIKKRVSRATGKKLNAAEALARARDKSRLERATQPVIDHLTAAVVAISALIDPQAIIFGGGTSEAGAALLSRLRKEVRGYLEIQPRLVAAKLRGEAQLYGALWGAIHASRGSFARSLTEKMAPASSSR